MSIRLELTRSEIEEQNLWLTYGAEIFQLLGFEFCMRNIYIISVHMSTAQNEQRSNILRLRRRFLKDQEKTSFNYAQKEIQQQRLKKVTSIQEPTMLFLFLFFF